MRRRNRILRAMARNGYLHPTFADGFQRLPIRVAVPNPIQTIAPAAIGAVFDELKRLHRDAVGIDALFDGRIAVVSTVDARIQAIANQALERGLQAYEKRHRSAAGDVEGAVVVLRNADAAILAEIGGRQVHGTRRTRYFDFNRVTRARRQPGSAIKPIVYLAAFRAGFDLESRIPDEPIAVSDGAQGDIKWVSNYDDRFLGPIPLREALAQSRNAATVWLAREVGMASVLKTARSVGIRTRQHAYLSTALGASEVRLVELANAYRVMASGVLAEPHVVDHVRDPYGVILHRTPAQPAEADDAGLDEIQEALRGVVRLPTGTAHALAGRGLRVPVMGKTGTTSDFRDAWFIGSTYGPKGVTVGVWIGFDDNRAMGRGETGARTALPVFRDIVAGIHAAGLVGPAPRFPRAIEEGIDAYLTSPSGS